MPIRLAGMVGATLAGLVLLAACGSPPPPPPESESPEATTPAPTDAAAGSTTPAPKIPIAVQPFGFEKKPDPGYETTQRYMKQFYDDQLEALHAEFSAELKKEIPLDQLRRMREDVRSKLGDEVEVIAEDSQTHDDYRGFARRVRFSKFEGVIEIQWILRPDDSIAGFMIKQVEVPAEDSPE